MHLSQKNKNLSSHIHKNLYTNMFIAPLCITAPKQETAELPLGGEWLNILWHPYQGMLFSSKSK